MKLSLDDEADMEPEGCQLGEIRVVVTDVKVTGDFFTPDVLMVSRELGRKETKNDKQLPRPKVKEKDKKQIVHGT